MFFVFRTVSFDMEMGFLCKLEFVDLVVLAPVNLVELVVLALCKFG